MHVGLRPPASSRTPRHLPTDCQVSPSTQDGTLDVIQADLPIGKFPEGSSLAEALGWAQRGADESTGLATPSGGGGQARRKGLFGTLGRVASALQGRMSLLPYVGSGGGARRERVGRERGDETGGR